jgi:hypothetical protein
MQGFNNYKCIQDIHVYITYNYEFNVAFLEPIKRSKVEDRQIVAPLLR